MLAQADKVFINSVNNDILKDRGPVWQAAYKSFFVNYHNAGSEWDGDIDVSFKQGAEKFADKFVEELKNQKVAEKFANALNSYIKLALNTPIIVPDPSSGTTLATSAGPVTGTINIKII